ncbi:hypothetical protein LINPERPRIM_LOCUS19119 [Linum perenne]
MSNNLAAR